MTPHLMDFAVFPTCGEVRQPTACRLGLTAASSERENFVANEVQTYGLWFRAIKEESFDGLSDVGAQLFPSVTLCENIFGQALGGIAPFSLFNHFKNKLADVNRFHANFLSQELSMEVSTMPASLSRASPRIVALIAALILDRQLSP